MWNGAGSSFRKTPIFVVGQKFQKLPLHVPSAFTCVLLFDLSESCKYNTYVPLLPSPHEIKYSAVFFISWHFISFVCLIDTTQKFELDKMHGTKRLQLSYVWSIRQFSSYSTYLHMHREVTYDAMTETESDWFVATFRPIFRRTKSRLSRELRIIHSLFTRASCMCQAGQGAVL